METIYDIDTPLAAYLEGNGYIDGDFQPSEQQRQHSHQPHTLSASSDNVAHDPFAPPNCAAPRPRKRRRTLVPDIQTQPGPQSAVTRAHNAWSTAVNSRLGRTDNEKFMEHFRYVIVASQLLNEYLDYGTLQSSPVTRSTFDSPADAAGRSNTSTSVYGAAATIAIALALVLMIHWARSRAGGSMSRGRIGLALTVFAVLAVFGYAYIRRQWLKFVRHNAVTAASMLTANWQAFEVSSSSAMSFIQEVELVSKGYRISSPLPPVSRMDEKGAARRCGRLRKSLHKSYASIIPTCMEASAVLRSLIDEDDLEKYCEVYDLSAEEAKDAGGEEAMGVFEDDPESLKSLRVLSYRAGVLRRVTLCALMALEADGGKPDFRRWRVATEVIQALNSAIASSATKLNTVLSEMETLTVPQTPIKTTHAPSREKMRSQVRKISMLSSGIRGLQAKMQVLREETNRSIEQSDEVADLGPSLMTQYESIGSDLRELMQAWETGKASLQTNISKQERRISLASSGLRSPVSSLGGLTAVDEGGSPADALKLLNGDSVSNRSSLATTPSDEEQVFEAIAMPKVRSSLTREERIAKMHEERERQITMRSKRESNTSMLRELESVINLRPKREPGVARITSI